YGLRVQDDQAYIRSRTGFTFQNPDEGGEIGFAPGPFFVASSITNGVAGDTDVEATINGYGMFEDIPVVRNILAGASFARLSNKLNEGCVYARSTPWHITYLGEVDFINDRPLATAGKNSRNQLAAYAEVDWLFFDWLNIRGQFDYVQVSNDRNQVRYSIGAEPFISRFLQP